MLNVEMKASIHDLDIGKGGSGSIFQKEVFNYDNNRPNLYKERSARQRSQSPTRKCCPSSSSKIASLSLQSQNQLFSTYPISNNYQNGKNLIEFRWHKFLKRSITEQECEAIGGLSWSELPQSPGLIFEQRQKSRIVFEEHEEYKDNEQDEECKDNKKDKDCKDNKEVVVEDEEQEKKVKKKEIALKMINSLYFGGRLVFYGLDIKTLGLFGACKSGIPFIFGKCFLKKCIGDDKWDSFWNNVWANGAELLSYCV